MQKAIIIHSKTNHHRINYCMDIDFLSKQKKKMKYIPIKDTEAVAIIFFSVAFFLSSNIVRST